MTKSDMVKQKTEPFMRPDRPSGMHHGGVERLALYHFRV